MAFETLSIRVKKKKTGSLPPLIEVVCTYMNRNACNGSKHVNAPILNSHASRVESCQEQKKLPTNPRMLIVAVAY